MSTIAELILSIVGKDETAGAFKSAGSGLKEFEKGALVAATAVSGAGAGIDALARSQAESNQITRQNAAALGMSEDAYRKLALSISSAGLPIEDVNKLFETGRQEGLTNGEDLKKYAQFWDDVGDATGKAGTDLAASATGLRAVGIAAGDEGKALGAFGFITDHTKLGVDGFLDLLGKKGSSIQSFGLNVDDAAAILGDMEKNLGLTGRAASTEFASALDKSDGTLDGLLKTLGLSKESFTELRGQVDQSSGVIERNAAIQDATITPLQRWQNKLHELAFAHADLIQGLDQFAPVLMAAGPAMGAFSAGIRGAGMAATFAKGPLLSMAMALLTPPLGIIIALVAVGVAIYLFRDQIMDAVKAAADYVLPIFESIKKAVTGAIGGALDFVREHWPEIATILSGPFAPIVALATDSWGVRSALTDAIDGMKDYVKEHWPEIATILAGPFAPIVALATDSWGVRTALGNALDGMLDNAKTWGGNVTSFFADLPGKILDALGDLSGFLFDKGKDLIQGFINGITSIPVPNPLDLVGDAAHAGGSLNPLNHLPGRAVGGPVMGGSAYVVGENGPEIFWPASAGRIVPNHQLGAFGGGGGGGAPGAGGGLTLNFNGPITFAPPGSPKDQLQTIGFAVASTLRRRGIPMLT